MRLFFYGKLAGTGIRKNRQLYLPYILTCTGMVMIFYIIAYLSDSPLLSQMSGGATMESILNFGKYIIGLFSLIFLFYTNSFLIRRRNREFGLYNILGMDKNNISRILIWECLIVAVISLLAGLAGGLLFSKLAELGLLKILHADVTYTLSIAVNDIVQTIGLFAGIFLLILISSLCKVRVSRPMELLQSEHAGEKAPKGNGFIAFVGLVLLAAAYYLAVTIEDPIVALAVFFVAVMMVIVATYLLFISGSVVFCRILRSKKIYYYKPNHFISVSSMAYRMKRNGAGLASICILSTGVLIMISSTASLFIGAEDALREMSPNSYTVHVGFSTPESCTEEHYGPVRGMVRNLTEDCRKNEVEYTMAETSGMLDKDGNIIVDQSQIEDYDSTKIGYYYIFSLEEYNRLAGTEVTLNPGEALIFGNERDFPYDQISFDEQMVMNVRKINSFPISVGSGSISPFSHYYLVVPDFAEYIRPMLSWTSERGYELGTLEYVYAVDVDKDLKEQLQLKDTIFDNLQQYFHKDGTNENRWEDYTRFDLDSYAEHRENFYSLYGCLFFLGIMLSIVFVFATVLIIYYKQISEGYEDQSRFEIMQKVGMTKREIRKSINSQVLTVFFAPFLMAGLHLLFAFPLIWKILQCFGIGNLTLLTGVNIVWFLIFGVLYALVYRMTSQTYYRIVAA